MQMRTYQRARQGALLLGLVIASCMAQAYEHDVHFGLTQWLARKSGFTESESLLIAIGNQRVDGGDIRYVKISAMYACSQVNKNDAEVVRDLHFPGGSGSDASGRSVRGGSPAASARFDVVLRDGKGKESRYLAKLGESLHPVQDSWAHRGNSEAAPQISGLQCDPRLTWAHPREKGGGHSHSADHTYESPDDAVEMARSTFDMLARFRTSAGWKNSNVSWSSLEPDVRQFAVAKTKSEKQAWFVSHGLTDTTFLSGITLPNGGGAFNSSWSQDRLPSLSSFRSPQLSVDLQLRDIFSDFIAAWLSSPDLETVATKFGASDRTGKRGSEATQLLARMRLWRIRDHGSIQDIAHHPGKLNAQQLKRISADKSWVMPLTTGAASDAVIPILPPGEMAVPLLPFFVADATSSGSPSRGLAFLKLKTLPYDLLIVTAERRGNAWVITSIDSTVEH